MTKPSFSSFLFSVGIGQPDGVMCGTVRDFVVVSLASDEYTIQWCDIDDPNNWSTPGTAAARAAQAGSQTLNPHYGIITGIAGNDFFGYVFQQRAVTKMTYVGGDVVFAFDTFEEGRGCFEYERFDQIDDAVYFESEFGYHKLENDQITDIGYGKVDDTYTPSSSAEQSNVAINPAIKTVFFQDQNVSYNYKTDQWTRQPAFAGDGYYPIDSADGVIGRIVKSGTAVDFQDSSNVSVATATMVTSEYALNDFGRSVVDEITPIHDGTALQSITVHVGVRDLPKESVTWCTGPALHLRTGATNFRGGAIPSQTPAEGKFHRAKFIVYRHTTNATTTTMAGADVVFFPAGGI